MKSGGQIGAGEVIEKQAADAALFIAVREEKILIASGFKAGIKLWAESVAGGFGGGVPCDDVFEQRIKRGEVKAAAEPANRWGIGRGGGEEADIHVGGGHPWIEGVEHEGDAGGVEGGVGEVGACLGCGLRECGAVDVGKIDTGLLENLAVSEDVGTPAAAAGALPWIGDKMRGGVEGLQVGGQLGMQCGERLKNAGQKLRHWKHGGSG